MNLSAEIDDLRIDNKTNPLCVEGNLPCFSWKFKNYRDGFAQSAYRIMVATTEALLQKDSPDCWDSGKVVSDMPVYIAYEGKALSASTEYYWKVKVWDGEDKECSWSRPAFFRTGILNQSDWGACWIGYDKEVIKPFDPGKPYYVADDYDKGENELHLPPAPFLKKDFILSKPVKKAYVSVSALGLYELHINGERIGSDYFTPGWSDYRKRVYYDTYKAALKEGSNTIGIILADGWYSGYVGLKSRHVWGDKPRVMARLEIEYADGTHDAICTDETWQAGYGDIREADLMHGEKHDARFAIRGWDQPGCEEFIWDKPDVSGNIDIRLQAHVGPYNHVIERLRPTLIGRRDDNSLLYDMGKNINGFISLKNIDEPEGTEIVFDYGEHLDDSGCIDKKVYRSVRAADYYIACGSGGEMFEPRFTFRGFRYVAVKGLTKQPGEGDLQGIFIASDMRPAGHFECSDKMINDIYEMLKNTVRCNYLEVPMDCCDRDECLGWGQDGNHTLRFASYLFDVSDFILKWENDILDGQKENGVFPATAPYIEMGDVGQFEGDIMADHGLQIPWILYKMYGNKRLFEQCYEALKKYFSFMQGNSDRDMRFSITGDWLSILDNGYTDYAHGWGNTSRDLMGTAFYAYGAYIIKRMAEVLNKTEDAEAYGVQLEKTRKAFINTFELRGNRFRDLTQTGYALALHFELVSDDMEKYVARYLYEDVVKRNSSITGGLIGITYILDALSEHGYHDAAVRAMTSDQYPSYGYMLKMNATTCWERWDALHHLRGVHPHPMNSYNHGALTPGGAWFYKRVAGIDYITPGFKETRIEPHIEGSVSWAKASYESVFGTIRVEWEKKNGGAEFSIAIPPNVKATVLLPFSSEYTASDALVFSGMENGKMAFSTSCGNHYIRLDHV